MRTGKLEPHSPDYYSLNQKPFPYNPKARPKYFIKFLKESFGLKIYQLQSILLLIPF